MEDSAGNSERAALCVAHLVLSEIARDLIPRSAVYVRRIFAMGLGPKKGFSCYTGRIVIYGCMLENLVLKLNLYDSTGKSFSPGTDLCGSINGVKKEEHVKNTCRQLP